MSWWDKLPWNKKKNTVYVNMLNGHTPIFSQFGQDIYTSDVVQQALVCIVNEMKKLNPIHVRTEEMGETPVSGSSIQRVLNSPNDLMTKADFIEKITWSLLFNENAFVVPVYNIWRNEKGEEKRNYTALYPVQPVHVELGEDTENTMWITMKFANNFEIQLPYKDVIHIRHNFSVNEFMGGNELGQPNNAALLKTLELNNTLLQGVSAAMKSSFTINGVVKYNTLMDGGKTEAALKELEERLKNSESGFLPLDLKAEYIPIKKEIKLVDADTLKFIDEKILRNYGVSLPILTGDYTKPQYEAFYQKTLEPYIIAYGQAFTKALFSQRERSFGNEILFFPKKLIFMTAEQTLEVVKYMGDRGSIYENEARVAFGFEPLEELRGKRMQSLNYIDTKISTKYQMQGKESTVEKNE